MKDKRADKKEKQGLPNSAFCKWPYWDRNCLPEKGSEKRWNWEPWEGEQDGEARKAYKMNTPHSQCV